MDTKTLGYLPKLLYKVYLYLKEKFDPRPEVTFEEISCVEICKKLICLQSSNLTFAPKSMKRFIKNDEHSMFIVIENRIITIINHVYSYSVYIENTELYGELLENFDDSLENRRNQLENEIRNNIQHSLKDILDKLNPKTL
jgi:hypothetical protein